MEENKFRGYLPQARWLPQGQKADRQAKGAWNKQRGHAHRIRADAGVAAVSRGLPEVHELHVAG